METTTTAYHPPSQTHVSDPPTRDLLESLLRQSLGLHTLLLHHVIDLATSAPPTSQHHSATTGRVEREFRQKMNTAQIQFEQLSNVLMNDTTRLASMAPVSTSTTLPNGSSRFAAPSDGGALNDVAARTTNLLPAKRKADDNSVSLVDSISNVASAAGGSKRAVNLKTGERLRETLAKMKQEKALKEAAAREEHPNAQQYVARAIERSSLQVPQATVASNSTAAPPGAAAATARSWSALLTVPAATSAPSDAATTSLPSLPLVVPSPPVTPQRPAARSISMRSTETMAPPPLDIPQSGNNEDGRQIVTEVRRTNETTSQQQQQPQQQYTSFSATAAAPVVASAVQPPYPSPQLLPIEYSPYFTSASDAQHLSQSFFPMLNFDRRSSDAGFGLNALAAEQFQQQQQAAGGGYMPQEIDPASFLLLASPLQPSRQLPPSAEKLVAEMNRVAAASATVNAATNASTASLPPFAPVGSPRATTAPSHSNQPMIHMSPLTSPLTPQLNRHPSLLFSPSPSSAAAAGPFHGFTFNTMQSATAATPYISAAQPTTHSFTPQHSPHHHSMSHAQSQLNRAGAGSPLPPAAVSTMSIPYPLLASAAASPHASPVRPTASNPFFQRRASQNFQFLQAIPSNSEGNAAVAAAATAQPPPIHPQTATANVTSNMAFDPLNAMSAPVDGSLGPTGPQSQWQYTNVYQGPISYPLGSPLHSASNPYSHSYTTQPMSGMVPFPSPSLGSRTSSLEASALQLPSALPSALPPATTTTTTGANPASDVQFMFTPVITRPTTSLVPFRDRLAALEQKTTQHISQSSNGTFNNMIQGASSNPSFAPEFQTQQQ